MGDNVGVPGTTPFNDIGDYLAIPRLTSLRVSPDGSWLAAVVEAPGPEPKKLTTSIWRIDTVPVRGDTVPSRGAPPDPHGPESPAVQAEPRQPIRLTRSAQGESDPRFLPDGSLLFIS